MGSLFQPNIYSHRYSITMILVFSLVLCLFPAVDTVASGEDPHGLPSGLPHGDWDHVIITDQQLVSSFAPLAKHRRHQGLRCRIVSLHVAQHWAGDDDLMAAIRWFVSAAHEQWGVRYVLLGGDAEMIPVPMGFYDRSGLSWEIPMDLYYAAPGGDWDVDGDGILGEAGDDAPDLTPVVALGRAPVADRSEALAFVEKVIAFESDCRSDEHDVLLAAEVAVPYPWYPGLEVRSDMAWETEDVAELLVQWEAIGDFQRLYQNWEGTEGAEPLSSATFLEALNTGEHRFLGMMVHANVAEWSLGADLLRQEQLAGLAGMDHSLFMVPGAPGAADCRSDGMLETMLIQPVGGCVGAVAPSCLFYIRPGTTFMAGFWQRAADGSCERVGDSYRQTMADLWETYPSEVWMPNLQCMSLMGDPALLFLPVEGREPPRHGTGPKLSAVASPNPFNPTTEISFDVPGDSGSSRSVTVDIHDLAGRRLARILDADLEAGPQAVLWHGRDSTGRSMGSGLFFARIHAGSDQAVVKLILVQ
jgi:Peptidase family C25